MDDLKMTEDEILELPAGRETDALVAKANGDTVDEHGTWHARGDKFPDISCADGGGFYYTTEIKDAWRLIPGGETCTFLSRFADDRWYCDLRLENDRDPSAYAETAPLAICRAFLLAKHREACDG